MTHRKIFCAFLFVVSLHFSAEAGLMVFLDEDEWLSALTNSTLTKQTFDGASNNFSANSNANAIGTLLVELQGGVGDPGPTGLTGSGFFRGELDASGADQLSLRFSFESVYGFALSGLQNDSSSNPFNLALDEIALSVGDEQFVLSEIKQQNTADIPFLGFVSDDLIDSFSLFHAQEIRSITRTSEQFFLDELIFAEPDSLEIGQSADQIPEPPIIMLMSLGLIGLLVSRRRISLVRADGLKSLVT